MFTEPVFYRGRHGQESEEGKEDREGSHQEGGKEDLKEKEVIVSATEKLPPPGRNPDAKRTSPKDLKCSLQPFGIAARHYKAGPLCSWLLHKGPIFRFRPGEGHDLALARRIDAAWPRRSCGAVHESLFRRNADSQPP
jgi:hypothetical protein